jgi:inner membrane protein involved in colicin E2 resistance
MNIKKILAYILPLLVGFLAFLIFSQLLIEYGLMHGIAQEDSNNGGGAIIISIIVVIGVMALTHNWIDNK